MLSVDEALGRVLAAFGPLGTEWVALTDGLGRALAADLAAVRDQPPLAVSSMDGYAVRAADMASGEAVLRIIGEVPAGGTFDGEVRAGETVRIFTGAPVPAGSDAIVIQENATPLAEGVRLRAETRPGAFVRPAGLDFAKGETGVVAGTVLTARSLAFAAAMGHVWLNVRRRPRVAVLSTGNELVRPGTQPAPHQIVSSNAILVTTMVSAWGGEAIDLGIARDDPEEVRDAWAGAASADLLVTSGGASVGDHDRIRDVLGEDGLDLDFWRVAMRPGKPLIFGRVRGVPLIGLPGNPVSAGVCALLFVRAAIRRMLGLDPRLDEVEAVLAAPLGPNDERQDYLRSTWASGPGSPRRVDPAPRQDSSMLATFSRADCLVVRPPFAPAMAIGDPVRVIPLADGAVQI